MIAYYIVYRENPNEHSSTIDYASLEEMDKAFSKVTEMGLLVKPVGNGVEVIYPCWAMKVGVYEKWEKKAVPEPAI